MMGLSKWKVALYLAAIFLAGGVSGWVVATKTAKQKVFTAPRSDEIAASLRTSMHSKLNLTDGQKQQIDAIIERSSKTCHLSRPRMRFHKTYSASMVAFASSGACQ